MDLTSPAFVEEALHLAHTGDSLSIWFIMRLLRNHAPFQICLNKGWVPIPHPDEQVLVRYHSGPRNSQCPDPYAAADLIHQLAVVFSTNPNLSPRRAYYLTYCLYYYSRRHGSPVYPSLVRALFHAGVVRFRQEKLHVSAFRYDWIMWIVQKFEGDEVVAELNNNPEIRGLTTQRDDNR